ncbi:MAG: hypothetical protein IPJ87_00900 [Flavobacteriales bacterium]|nr:hypothetical protein [Flavobacteriales bacterium]MBK8950160.1 hypothetical protein [Flavobacteriales bacterium]MBK9699406.1 hypothetical protein [Flavobacteriales bacterium]
MKKFLVTYIAPAEEAMKMMASATPEQKEAGMKPWMDWMAKCGSALLDGGAPLMPGHAIDPKGNWSGSKRDITGYSILQAENIDAAKKLVEGHPHLMWLPTCSVEVSEMIPMK